MAATSGGGGTTMPSTRAQRQQLKQQQQQQQQHRRISRESESSKLFPTDESDRSLGSDLTDRTAGAAGGGIGVGGAKDPSLLSYQTKTSTAFVHHPSLAEGDNFVLPAPVAVSPVRQLLDVINMSILPSELRLISLTQAMEFLDHRDKNVHDAELRDDGVAFVLYQKLGLVLQLSRCCSDVVLYERGAGGRAILGSGGMDNVAKRRPSLGGESVGSSSSTQCNSRHPQSFAIALALQRQSDFDKEIAMLCS